MTAPLDGTVFGYPTISSSGTATNSIVGLFPLSNRGFRCPIGGSGSLSVSHGDPVYATTASRSLKDAISIDQVGNGRLAVNRSRLAGTVPWR
ncbi:MAG TPA: hypothetical protein VME47_22300 [Acetobacteraceae bacterium]|nr:hypothetical protein [Acetobacteraceae bacterium]